MARTPSKVALVLVAAAAGWFVWNGAARDAAPADDEKAIRQVLDAQVAAWNKGDLDGFLATYWKDKDLTFYSGGDVQRGWEETATRYRKSYKAEGKEMGTLTFSDASVDVLSADAAFVRARWKLTMTDEKKSGGGLFTLVVRKKADGWRIVHDHTSK